MNLGFWEELKTSGIQSGFPNGLQYWQKIKNLNPIAYWPLWDAVGSSSVVDLQGLGNGTPSNVTFGATGIGDGRTAASFNGTNSYINVHSAAFASAFSGVEGSFSLWFKMANAGVWTDAATRVLLNLFVDTNNNTQLVKESANNTLRFQFKGGGTAKTVSPTISSTDWVHAALTWSDAANEVKAYLSGSQTGTTQTKVTFTGTLASSLLGSFDTLAFFHSGTLAHVALWTSALTPAQILTLATV